LLARWIEIVTSLGWSHRVSAVCDSTEAVASIGSCRGAGVGGSAKRDGGSAGIRGRSQRTRDSPCLDRGSKVNRGIRCSIDGHILACRAEREAGLRRGDRVTAIHYSAEAVVAVHICCCCGISRSAQCDRCPRAVAR
jgi:hypothetical protein